MDMAMKVGVPCIGIEDSGGARIQEGVDALAGYGDIFYRNTLASGVVPADLGHHGSLRGRRRLLAGPHRLRVHDRGQRNMFITGPQVIKAVTGEDVSAEALGGADVHAATSGVAHFAYPDEASTIAGIKKLLSYLPQNNVEDPPLVDSGDDPGAPDPGLAALMPDQPNKPYDIRDVIAQVFDSTRANYFEVQPLYAQNMLTCFARLAGGPWASSPTSPR